MDISNDDYEEISIWSNNEALDEKSISLSSTNIIEPREKPIFTVSTDEFEGYVARCHSNQNKEFKAQYSVRKVLKNMFVL